MLGMPTRISGSMAVPGASIVLKVFPPRDGADAYLMRGAIVVPGDSVTSRVDFALPKGVLVRGRVTEAGTGRPVAGAVVHHQAHERNNPYFIRVNPACFRPGRTESGHRRRRHVPPGHHAGPRVSPRERADGRLPSRGNLVRRAGRRASTGRTRGPIPTPCESSVRSPTKAQSTSSSSCGAASRCAVISSIRRGQPVREALLVSRWYLSRMLAME